MFLSCNPFKITTHGKIYKGGDIGKDMKNTLRNLIGIGAIAVASLVGCSQPEVKGAVDVNNDGIKDLVVEIKYGFQNGKWLFVSKKDGNYVRATFWGTDGPTPELRSREYYRTDDGERYSVRINSQGEIIE
jgi:hypothetical protein